MEYRIFFKDKTNALKGPFTERQVQEWYRKGWFENAFPFYFTRSDECPSDEKNSGITLDYLRSLNGFGCPFFKVDEREQREFEKKRRDRVEKLESIEKEIAELHQQCDVVLCLEKTIERMDKEVEELTTIPSVDEEKVEEGVNTGNSLSKKKKKNKKKKKKDKNDDKNEKDMKDIAKPDFISDDIWQEYYEVGDYAAKLIIVALQTYATGRFDNWEIDILNDMVEFLEPCTCCEGGEDIVGRNLVCEYLLIEKMKMEEFFCCELCKLSFFNYKQTLIHFTSNEHCKMETAEVRESGIDAYRIILDSFTKLPSQLAENDAKMEQDRRLRNGTMVFSKSSIINKHPTLTFLGGIAADYQVAHDEANPVYTGLDLYRTSPIFCDTTFDVAIVKGEFGRKKFAELHKHLAQAQTCCMFCECLTGDREGFYAHFLSSAHLRGASNFFKKEGLKPRTDTLTMLVNLHRKDLA